jgi:hypothetical protein
MGGEVLVILIAVPFLIGGAPWIAVGLIAAAFAISEVRL